MIFSIGFSTLKFVFFCISIASFKLLSCCAWSEWWYYFPICGIRADDSVGDSLSVSIGYTLSLMAFTKPYGDLLQEFGKFSQVAIRHTL